MTVPIKIHFRKFRRLFNPDEWMSRLLNLSKADEASSVPGLLMIQIDGLGFTQFERAMQKGNMPFLARLLKRGCYTNHRHYTGLPSNTPAVQGALFYGVKSCVPAFSFKDSLSGKVFNMFNPESALTIEERIKEKGDPLLKGGSAYGNIFTGGAKEAHFCAASMGWGSMIKAANPFGTLLTVILNFHIFIRALFLIFLEFILSVVDCIRGILRGKNFLGEIGFIPLRVAVCVLLRESIAVGARIDIARGLPVIHVNFAGYDEQAHHRGPKSAFAHWSLKGIDSAIAKAWKAAQRSGQRSYEVFIYSDHGQEHTISYHEEFGLSINEAVNQILEEKIISDKREAGCNRGIHYWRAYALRSQMKKGTETKKTEDKNEPPHAVVSALGNVGHIYFPAVLTLGEKEKIAEQLTVSAHIPIVMAPSSAGQAIAWTIKGKFVLPDEADKVVETDHPFYKEVVRDLVGLCHHPDAGGLIMFGWRKGMRSLTFHAEQGTHAGIGPEETSGFALLPAGAIEGKEAVCTQDLRRAAFCARGLRFLEAGTVH